MMRAIDIAQYVVSNYPAIGRVRIQQLLYYAQGWSLAWRQKPLFEDEIEAWDIGPVIPEIYRWLELQKEPTRVTPQRQQTLGKNESLIIEAIVSAYAGLPGDELLERIRNEMPWQRARGDVPEGEPSSTPISHEDLTQEFLKQQQSNIGPTQPVLSGQSFSTVDRSERIDIEDRIAEQLKDH